MIANELSESRSVTISRLGESDGDYSRLKSKHEVIPAFRLGLTPFWARKSQQLPCFKIVQIVVTLRVSESAPTNRAGNRRERRRLGKCLPYFCRENKETNRRDPQVKVRADHRTSKHKIAVSGPDINNVHPPSVDDRNRVLEPPSRTSGVPAGSHRVSEFFAFGNQLGIALSFEPSRHPFFHCVLIQTLAPCCHPKLLRDLAYSFPCNSELFPYLGKCQRVLGQQVLDSPVLAVVDRKPMVTTVAACNWKTAFTSHQLPYLSHWLLFSFIPPRLMKDPSSGPLFGTILAGCLER